MSKAVELIREIIAEGADPVWDHRVKYVQSDTYDQGRWYPYVQYILNTPFGFIEIIRGEDQTGEHDSPGPEEWEINQVYANEVTVIEYRRA